MSTNSVPEVDIDVIKRIGRGYPLYAVYLVIMNVAQAVGWAAFME